MNRPDDHGLYEELAAGHALSALEPEEEHVFLEHLATCSRCQAEVQEHRSTLALIASALPPVEPPPALWEGIRAGLRPPTQDDAPLPTAPAQHRAPGPRPVGSLAAARERRSGRVSAAARWTGVAAAAALVVGLGAWNVTLRADRSAELERSERLAAAVRQLGQPGTGRVPLASEKGEVLAVAVVQDQSVSLVIDGLAPNPDDTSYVLWTQSPEGELRPVQAFDVSEDVDVVEDLPVEDGASGVAAFALSREEGSTAPPQPLGPVVASGAV